MMTHYGMSESEIRRIILHELDKNPDLQYYINNPYFDEYVSLLIDGISKAIVENSRKVIDDVNNEIKRQQRVWG